ncbi:hypothetical protein EDB81DRAFT_701451 [Dactylonectria macrodidyma]|uniref:NAD-dependent epimerase/dehydratase domain-containing protein n=1 Tax=Dactylonectria macrodidyma TaxID=307937 RepID=A0A9P9DGA0_9HYPO|nr:hypothetical protein EDB81DRAFT_701451 [Dactylonectria macrodidyma]
MPLRFQFVNVSNPGNPASSETRTLTHSHAIRQAHAKERRLRMQRYHSETSQVNVGEHETTALEPRFPGPLSQIPDNSRDPFSTLPRSMSSQEYFLLDYYVRSVVPNMVTHCSTFNSVGNLEMLIIRDWVSLAIMDAEFLSAILLGACRHILRDRPDDPNFTRMALRYRQTCLQALRQTIGGISSAVSLLTFAKSLALAFDERLSVTPLRQELLLPNSAMGLEGQYISYSGLKSASSVCQECSFFLLSIQLFITQTSIITMSSSPTSIPVGSWVLVTGATGFVASQVTKQFLERGYKVRGTVRDLSQASWLVDDRFKSYVENGSLELVAVPDLGAEGAFDEAVKGVSAIAHIATISSLDPNPNNVIPQTVAGTVSILKAALTEPSVQEVVYTSTLLTATFPVPGNDIRVERHTWNDAAIEAAWAPPPYEASRSLLSYTASKVAAEKELWKFVEENQPHFTVNVVSPASIVGEPLHRKHADSPVYWVSSLFKGDKIALEAFHASFFVDVKDIALLHIAAILDPEVKNARLQAWGHSHHWNDLLAILRKLRPQKEFIADYSDRFLLTISTDFSDSIALLKKWAGQDGWRSLEGSIAEGIDSSYFQVE